MNRSGFYKMHSDGMQTFTPTGSSSAHASNHILKAAEQQQKEKQEMIDYFIMPEKFVGAEMPLNRAVRELMADKIKNRGKQ